MASTDIAVMTTAASTPMGVHDTTSRHTPSKHSYGSLMITFPTPSVVRGSIIKKGVSPRVRRPQGKQPFCSTTSTKGSGPHDLVRVNPQQVHKDRIKETNLLNPSAPPAHRIQAKCLARNCEVFKGNFIGLVANEVAIMIAFDHEGFAVEGN